MGLGHVIRTATLGPVVFLQGRWVRRRTPLLPEPPGPRAGVAGGGEPLRLLVVGDSAAAGVGAPDLESALLGQLLQRLTPRFEVHWELRARTGATTRDVLGWLRSDPPGPQDAIVTSLGVNDVTSMRTLPTFRREQDELRRLLADTASGLLIVSGLPPVHAFPALPQPLRWYLGSRAREFSARLGADVAGAEHCDFLPIDFGGTMDTMASDGYHPGPQIYALWAAAAADRILERRSA